MSIITAEMVKHLRDKTGAGMMDCKKALKETNGNEKKALELLREMGLASARKKASRVANNGKIGSYIHANGTLGVLVEINCETDFVANTEDFNTLIKDIAMQVAASSPVYVSKEDVPEDVIEKEREFQKKQLIKEGKPENIVGKIVEGKLNKFFEEICLLEQYFIKDTNIKVKNVIDSTIAKLGENIVVRKFARFKIGEE